MKKYILTTNTIVMDSITLTQIQRLADGLLGGWVEKESNLSQDGTCFVYGDAMVYGNARVYGNAQVSDGAMVYGNAQVSDGAMVYGNARVYGNAQVSDGAMVYGDAVVYGNARVYGNAVVYGNARVYGNAQVSVCISIQQLRNSITVVDTHIFIGCQGHTWAHWKENIQAIGKEAGYSDLEIRDVDKLLRVLTRQVRNEILKRRHV